MRILLTGASSGLGSGLLPSLKAAPEVSEIWTGSRRPAAGGAKVRFFPLDLTGPLDLPVPGPIDLAIHAAGLTHSSDPSRYDEVNHRGTVKLARALRAKGCRRVGEAADHPSRRGVRGRRR